MPSTIIGDCVIGCPISQGQSIGGKLSRAAESSRCAKTRGMAGGAAKPAAKKVDKAKQLEDLKKATKDVEDAVKDAKKEKGDADSKAKDN